MLRGKKAVFFDYDGVIADTMEDNCIAWQYAFSVLGTIIKREDYFPLEGLNPKGIAQALCKISGVDQKNVSLIVQNKHDYYKNHNNFRFYDGILELLSDLRRAGFKLALVSGGSRAHVQMAMSDEFISNFDALVTGDDVVAPKPDPEPYLKALEILGLKAIEAVVVENAVLGIQSAKAAKIFCIAICTTLDRKALKDADLIVKNHKKLVKKLLNLSKT